MCPQKPQWQGADRRGLSCYRAKGARFEGRDSGLLSCDCPVVKRPSCSWKGGKCQRQASWLHKPLGRSEPSSSSILPPTPSAVPPGAACSSCPSPQAQGPQPRARERGVDPSKMCLLGSRFCAGASVLLCISSPVPIIHAGMYLCFHFVDEETEAQRDEVNVPAVLWPVSG